MPSDCSEKAKAATEAIAAANARISEVEASVASVYARTMASLDSKGRHALAAGEPDPAIRARAEALAAKMDEEEEKPPKAKGAKDYPVKIKPKVSAEDPQEPMTPLEAKLTQDIADLKAAQAKPYIASMRSLREQMGLDVAAFDAQVDAMTPDQAIAAYSLESVLYPAMQAMFSQAAAPPPANVSPPGQPLPPLDQWGAGGPRGPIAPPAATPQPPYVASEGEFRL